jgi:hypothetical protein
MISDLSIRVEHGGSNKIVTGGRGDNVGGLSGEGGVELRLHTRVDRLRARVFGIIMEEQKYLWRPSAHRWYC